MKRWMLGPAVLAGAVAGGALVKRVWLDKYRKQKDELNAACQGRDLFYTWLLLEQKGADLAEYFSAHGYKTAAILGMNREGRRLFDSLKKSGEISVVFGAEIDNFAAVHETLTVCRVGDDPLPEADCMVVCDLDRVQEKIEAVRREFQRDVVTLAQVLSWLLERYEVKPWDGAIKGWPDEELRLAQKNKK